MGVNSDLDPSWVGSVHAGRLAVGMGLGIGLVVGMELTMWLGTGILACSGDFVMSLRLR